jgi:hypothetical protein
MSDLIPIDDAIDGEIVDETCACGNLGRLIVDPYDQDVNNRTTMVVLCGYCEREACADI